jgi:hypothetical protein
MHVLAMARVLALVAVTMGLIQRERKIHCTSFNDGNPMIHCKNALVTVTVDLGCRVG